MKRLPSLIAYPILIGIGTLIVVFSCAKPSENLIPDDYASWEFTSWRESVKGDYLNYQIPGHSNNGRKIFANKPSFDFKETKENGINRYDYPVGSMIVKEVYQGNPVPKDATPFQLTAMIKQPNDPRARGGWLWVVKDMKSGVNTVLNGEFCITCHANANEPHPYGDKNTEKEFRDYVFFPAEHPTKDEPKDKPASSTKSSNPSDNYGY